MWQITWMLSFLPNWFWSAILIVGVLGIIGAWVLKFLPFVNTYRLPIQVISVLALLVGVYYQGVIANEEKWKLKVAEAEEKAQIAQATALKINEELRLLNEKTTVVRDEKTKTITKYIDSWITKEITKTVEGPERVRIEKVIEYIERCPIPKELLDIHNQAAKGEEIKK